MSLILLLNILFIMLLSFFILGVFCSSRLLLYFIFFVFCGFHLNLFYFVFPYNLLFDIFHFIIMFLLYLFGI